MQHRRSHIDPQEPLDTDDYSVTVNGNSLSVTIPAKFTDIHDIDSEDDVEVETYLDRLVVRPLEDEHGNE